MPPEVRKTSRETRGEVMRDGISPQRMEQAGDLTCGVEVAVDVPVADIGMEWPTILKVVMCDVVLLCAGIMSMGLKLIVLKLE